MSLFWMTHIVFIKLCSLQLTLGSFLGLLGLCLEENRKQLVCALAPHVSFHLTRSHTSSVIIFPHVFPSHAQLPHARRQRV